MRAVPHPIDGNLLFAEAFKFVMPGSGDVARGLVLGLLLLGFISTSMSTIDSLLMSALQTAWYDLVQTDRIEKVLSEEASPADSHAIAESARRFLIPLALLMTLFFYGLWQLYGDNVLLFQPVMYAMPLALLGPALVGLFHKGISTHIANVAVFTGILAAIVAVVVMFWLSVRPGQSEGDEELAAGPNACGGERLWLSRSDRCRRVFKEAGGIPARADDSV